MMRPALLRRHPNLPRHLCMLPHGHVHFLLNQCLCDVDSTGQMETMIRNSRQKVQGGLVWCELGYKLARLSKLNIEHRRKLLKTCDHLRSDGLPCVHHLVD